MKTKRSIHKLISFKIVNKLTPNYLSDLLPQTVQQRSGLSLRNASDFSPFGVRTERLFKKSFFLQLLYYGIALILLIEIQNRLVYLRAH
jgi:hypothetical protein